MIRALPSRASHRALCLLPALLALGACSSTSDSGGGTGATLRNYMLYGAATPPPVVAGGPVDAQECPAVAVIPGRSAIRNGDSEGLRSQVSIANLARECVEGPNGSIVVKVGLEGRALLGPAGGSSAKFDVPVTVLVRRGDTVYASRTQRVAVSIPPGQGQANFMIVQGDLVVPPGSGEYDIEVGLGGGNVPQGRTRLRARMPSRT